LLTHVKHLPRDSAFARSQAGDFAYWDEQVELTAQVVDSTNRLAYYLLKVNGSDPAEPVDIQRPGATVVAPEAASLADFGAFLKG
jgi:hypothetical protein